MRPWISVCAWPAVWLGACGSSGSGPDQHDSMADWQSVKAEVRRRFPGVHQLSIEDYLARAASPGAALLLVDVRSQAEHDVSADKQDYFDRATDPAI